MNTYPPKPVGNGKATMVALSAALTSQGSSSVGLTSPPTTGTAGTAMTINGTVSPSATAVQVGLSTSNTTAPSSWTNATVTSGTWTVSLTPSAAGTYYIWAEQTSAPSIQVISSAVTIAAGSSGITMSLLGGSGNGGLVGDAFVPATGGYAGNWGSTTTIAHTTVVAPNIAYSGTGSGTIDHAIFWFDSSATNTTAPGSGTTTSTYNPGTALVFNASNAGGIYPGNGAAGTFYGTYAIYNSSSTLLGVVKTNALTIT